MVLSRTFLLALLAATGCGESLFDAHGKRDGGPVPGDGAPDGPEVPNTCPDECLGDAAANFPTGESSSGIWSYLEDTRDRKWTPMVVAGEMATGSPGNGIKRCSADPTAPGCQERPGALLISSAGSGTTADPAVEFQLKTAAPRTIRLALWAQSSSGHTIHLYRNSREDLLHRAATGPDRKAEHSVLVDALPGDRFLIAAEPMSTSAGTVALDFFIYDSDQDPPFPSACLLAVAFEAGSGDFVEDLCTSRDLESRNPAGSSPPTILGIEPPFPPQGNYVYIPSNNFLRAPTTVVRESALTIQFWVRVDSAQTGEGYVFSDLDELGGGRAFSLYTTGLDTRFQLFAHKSGPPSAELGILSGRFTANATSGVWRFVRIVETSVKITACIDGYLADDLQPAKALDIGADRPQAVEPLHLGKNAQLQSTASFDGNIDDFRVFSGALPCDPP